MSGSLSATGLSVRYETPHGAVHALRHVDIEAHPGEVIGIVGESGCGKSTLVTALANLLPANARVEGSIRYKGVDLAKLDAHRQRLLRGDEIALVSQDPMTAFNPVLTIGDQLLDFQHHRKDLGRGEKRARIAAMLGRVGIADAERRMHSYPHELSGGMRQRVAIARALALDPAVLLMDEPFGALDAITRDSMGQSLLEIWQRTGKTIVLVTHSIDEAIHLSRHVHVLGIKPGRITESLDIGLPYPRDLSVTEDPEFVRLVVQLRTMLRASHQPGGAS